MLDSDNTTEPSNTDAAAETAPAPRKRAPRKAAAKKAAQPATSTESPGESRPAASTAESGSGAAVGESGPAADAAAPAPRKRAPRKAAAKKAAPAADAELASAAEAPATEPPATEPPATEPPAAEPPAAEAAGESAPAKKAAKKAAAKKSPTKRATKKAAEAVAVVEAPTEAAPAPGDTTFEPADGAPAPAGEATPAAEATPAKRTPRKRAAKKAAPAASARETSAEPPAGAETPAAEAPANEPADGEASAAAMVAPGVLFVAPSEDRPRRRRTAKKAAEPASAEAEQPQLSGEAAPAPAEADIAVAEELEDQTAEPEDVREVAAEQATGARRRRRRGRRGRGGAKGAEGGDEAAEAEDEEGDEAATVTGEDESEEPAEGGTRRRRRRRRSGSSDDEPSGDEPVNTVTHVREPRPVDDGVKAVKGSTRLEAKRQRRRDGRETTRRRAPILTEAEFLARREAVDRVMAVRQSGDRTQIAVLEDDILVEHYVTRASATSYVGNVYLGRVQNVLPSMEAAFVDIGKGRNGVLYAGEVNWDAAGLEGKSRAIENALKSGDTVLVQVTKDPIGHKGARLTSQISLPGRFLVYVPGGGMTGISRRLPDTERHRLKAILKKIVPEDGGVIVRTAAEGASEEDLTRDVERLTAQWELIQQKAANIKSAPTLLHGEPDLAIRVVRDVFNEDFKSMVVQGDAAWETVSEYVQGVAPDLAERVSRHTKDTDLFHDLRVDEQLMKALDRKVWLPSGGSLIIDRTEAMTVIDVNTGKFVGAGGNLEQTVTRNNLEAAEEIVRQLRLRDVGGIVVIDFIDMVLESNRELVLRRLTECLGRDRTKHQVAEVTSLGLVQMTRKRVGEGLLEAFSETCEHCKGRGVILHTEPVERAGAAASGGEEDRPSGKSRRRRGKGGASAAEAELPAASEEQRKAASAAIAAIHRAAAGEKSEDGDGLDELASGLVAAAMAGSADGAAAWAQAQVEVETTDAGDDAAPAESAPAAGGSARTDGGAAPAEDGSASPEGGSASTDGASGTATAGSSGASEAAAGTERADGEAAHEAQPATEETPEPSVNGAQPAEAAPPRRRRRAASRPAGPPTAH